MAIRISTVASSRVSDDNKEIIVASTGKYTGDLELRFALECVDQLIDLLKQARGASGPEAKPGPAPGVAVSSVPSATQPNTGLKVAPKSNPDEVRFEIPKSFTVTADASGRGLVLMIVNHRLENQNGYAFSPDAAKQVADGLLKSADAVLATKNPAASPQRSAAPDPS